MKKKTFLVLGLGIFGSTIAKELSRFHQEVVAVDRDMTCVDRMSAYVTKPICCDFTNIEDLRAVGAEDVDAAIVATGSHLEESILAIVNLRELKVPYILAKAKNRRYGEVMVKVGADRVITPEKEMGLRMAKALLAANILDIIEIDKEYSIIEIVVPDSWLNRSLIALNLRSKLNINVLAIRKAGNPRLIMNPDPSYAFAKGDNALVVANNRLFENERDLERLSK